MDAQSRVPAVLSIAGSDSGGGAGIQADLKAFARCGVHGMTAITAITAQNTVGVEAVEVVSPEMIIAQVRAVAEDIGVDAVKVGMLGTAATVEAVVEALGILGGAPVVVDPVMVAESGAILLDDEARDALVERLLPLATVVTPNIPEARALTGAGEDEPQEDLAAPCPRPGARRGRGHRRPRERRATTSSSTAPRRSRSPASAIPAAPPTAPAAPTPRPWPPSSPAGPIAAGGRRSGPADRLRGGRRRAARDRQRSPARSTSSASPDPARVFRGGRRRQVPMPRLSTPSRFRA